MKLSRYKLINYGIALIVGTLVLVFSNGSLLKRLEKGVLDSFFLLRGPQPFDHRIIIVEIDDENIQKIGQWPWDREWFAASVQALKGLGAKSIFFDIIFSEPSTQEQDDLFSESIKQAGNVYLPFVHQRGTADGDERILFPINKFLKHLKDAGSINIYPDIDGILRRVPLIFMVARKLHYHVALQMAMDYQGLTVQRIEKNSLFLASSSQKIKIPFLKNYEMLVNWRGGWKKTYRHYSFLEVLNLYAASQDSGTYTKENEYFKDSICLVGPTGIGLHDIKPIPLEPEYPAVGVIANTIDNILNQDFITKTPLWLTVILIYLFAMLPSISAKGEKPLREMIGVFLLIPVFFASSLTLFMRGIWVDCSLPIVALFGSYSAINVYNLLQVAIDKKHFFDLSMNDELTGLYNMRFLKTALQDECGKAVIEENRKFCIVMMDIDNFKHINDTFGHGVGNVVINEVAGIIKGTVRTMDIVARYGGDEIIIILRWTALKGGLIAAEKLRKNIERHKISDGRQVFNITTSIGLACFAIGDDEETILKRADEGLYKAKDLGKNCVGTVEDVENKEPK